MKQILTTITVILASINLSFGEDFTVDNVKYNILSEEDKTLSVAGYYSGGKLGGILIPQTVGYNDIVYTVTQIRRKAFEGNGCITSVDIPPTITTIGASAFERCTAMGSVNISDLAAWCKISFSNRDSQPLRHSRLYLNGEQITDLIIPNGVTKIDAYTFYSCKGLSTVEIPVSVTSIGVKAFWACEDLKAIACYSETPISAREDMIYGSLYSNCILYVPLGAKEAYSNTAPWSKFSHIIETESNSVKDITIDDDVNVSVGDGTISVSGDEPVRIVAMNGATIYSGRGNCSVNVAKGIYIVIVGGKSHKVAV